MMQMRTFANGRAQGRIRRTGTSLSGGSKSWVDNLTITHILPCAWNGRRKILL
jgi:hypothetical protein